MTDELHIMSAELAALNGQGGPTWSRGDRFGFTADGKDGCFLTLQGYCHRPDVLGTFTRDPATGALTVVSSVAAKGGQAVPSRFSFPCAIRSPAR